MPQKCCGIILEEVGSGAVVETRLAGLEEAPHTCFTFEALNNLDAVRAGGGAYVSDSSLVIG
jgi:hypothetical protein